MIKHISFDYDKTLAYLNPPTHHLIPKLLNENGFNISIDSFKETCIKLRENLPRELKQRIESFGTLPKESRDQFIRDYNRKRIEMLQLPYSNERINKIIEDILNQMPKIQKKSLYEDVPPTIKKLKKKGLKLYILSGNNSNEIIEVLQSYKIFSLFEEIITVDKFSNCKVNNFQHLLTLTNAAPEEILHVGDEINTDGIGSRNMHINVLIIHREDEIIFNLEKVSEFKVIKTLPEIFKFLS